MLLLMDGVKYVQYEYSSEKEIEKLVFEHYKQLFGRDALLFNPQTMTTRLGIAARSDGLVLLPDQKQWCILEVELSSHPLDKHIIPQITRFNIAVHQPETMAKLATYLAGLIREDPFKMAYFNAKKIGDVDQYVSEVLKSPPTIAIVIDAKSSALEPVCKSLPFRAKTTEFRTFVRDDAPNVHIHLFEPLYDDSNVPKCLLDVLTVFDLFYKKNKTYDEAVEMAGKKLRLKEKTLRHMCTLDLGINADELRKIMVERRNLQQLLIEKFPDYETQIKEVIP